MSSLSNCNILSSWSKDYGSNDADEDERSERTVRVETAIDTAVLVDYGKDNDDDDDERPTSPSPSLSLSLSLSPPPLPPCV